MAAMRINSGETKQNESGRTEVTALSPCVKIASAANEKVNELMTAARKCAWSREMKYAFEEGRPKLPSCTIVATATLITAKAPTPSAPSQRATMIPAATLLKIISTRV